MISWTSISLLAAFGLSLIYDGLSSLVQPGVGEEHFYLIPVVVEEKDDVPLHRSRVVQSGDSVVEQE